MQNSKMVQYSLWHNCNNKCKFCLIDNKTFFNKIDQLKRLQDIYDNIDYIDWLNDFDRGISLLGGEIYFIEDKDLQDKLLLLLDKIIDKIILPNQARNNYYCKYSTVTNGMYEPTFFFKCMEKLISKVGYVGIDVNISYDIKYRYASEAQEQLVLKNIKEFQNRYPEYKLGIQSICTQYLIDAIVYDNFLDKWFKENPSTVFNLLYPHPIHTGEVLTDFFPTRDSIFMLAEYLLQNGYEDMLNNFHLSVKNSSIFKYTGLYHSDDVEPELRAKQKPLLSSDKVRFNKACRHSTLYQCYADSDKCLLCDLNNILGEQ